MTAADRPETVADIVADIVAELRAIADAAGTDPTIEVRIGAFVQWADRIEAVASPERPEGVPQDAVLAQVSINRDRYDHEKLWIHSPSLALVGSDRWWSESQVLAMGLPVPPYQEPAPEIVVGCIVYLAIEGVGFEREVRAIVDGHAVTMRRDGSLGFIPVDQLTFVAESRSTAGWTEEAQP